MSTASPSDIFTTEPLNPELLTAEDTGDFLPETKPSKYRHGKAVGKRELTERTYSSKSGVEYLPNARPYRFHESKLVPARTQHYCRDYEGGRKRRRNMKSCRNGVSETIRGGYLWAKDMDVAP
ncbi:hypothetical protein F4823DRAFT_196841 [Ustulina deusta]|nr:hypothetical protein F4823DRAFT_196841 [Ustulina deusta]